jgi:hypothetical protein
MSGNPNSTVNVSILIIPPFPNNSYLPKFLDLPIAQYHAAAFYLGNPVSSVPAFRINRKGKSRMMEHITRLSK